MNIVVSDLLTHYTRKGSGKIVVVIPGWADTSATWQAMQSDLSLEYDVIVIDLPGFGGTQMPPKAWGLAEYADFVAAFIKKLGIAEVYAIIGHSNGGAIAIKGLHETMLQAKKLLLVASAGVRDQNSGRKQALLLVAKTGKLITAPLPASVKNKLRQKLYKAARSDMLVAEHMQETFKNVVSSDVQSDAATITIPTLLLYGDRDTETPVSYGQKLQNRITGSKLQVFPGAGHFVFLDEPEGTAIAVKEFLSL